MLSVCALQDAIYLREYARALSLAGVRSPDVSTLVMFNGHSAGAITVERSLHEGFLKDLGVSREEAEATEASPTTLAYTSFLLRTAALGDCPEVLGAVLPCYWIYWEVGKAVLAFCGRRLSAGTNAQAKGDLSPIPGGLAIG